MFEQVTGGTLTSTVDGLMMSLDRYIPDDHYRRFYSWALSAHNPQRAAYLQITGISQLCNMVNQLHHGLVSEDILAPFSSWMNVYQIYEIVSDNLAIGLATFNPEDADRRALMIGFNDAMIARLSGDPMPTDLMLEPLQAIAGEISLFQQSLIPEHHRRFAALFTELYGGDMHAIEYGLWSNLVANIESCLDLVRATNSPVVRNILRAGLIRRYAGVNTLLQNPYLSIEERLAASIDAILVAPTLAYFVGGVIDEVAHEGLLEACLYCTSLLVRLLNDLGTGLMLQSPVERKAFMALLRSRSGGSDNLREVLCHPANRAEVLLTRIHKDLDHDEFNLGVFATPYVDTLYQFEQRIGYYAEVYQTTWRELKLLLHELTRAQGSEIPAKLLGRFVRFHEQLYANSYQDANGEYAI